MQKIDCILASDFFSVSELKNGINTLQKIYSEGREIYFFVCCEDVGCNIGCSSPGSSQISSESVYTVVQEKLQKSIVKPGETLGVIEMIENLCFYPLDPNGSTYDLCLQRLLAPGVGKITVNDRNINAIWFKSISVVIEKKDGTHELVSFSPRISVYKLADDIAITLDQVYVKKEDVFEIERRMNNKNAMIFEEKEPHSLYDENFWNKFLEDKYVRLGVVKDILYPLENYNPEMSTRYSAKTIDKADLNQREKFHKSVLDAIEAGDLLPKNKKQPKYAADYLFETIPFIEWIMKEGWFPEQLLVFKSFKKISLSLEKKENNWKDKNLGDQVQFKNQQPTFKQPGDYWKLIYDGKETSVKNLKGMKLIHSLLSNQGKYINIADLNCIVNTKANTDEVIDQQTKMEIQTTLNEINNEIEQAKLSGDIETVNTLEKQKDDYFQYLNASLNNKGKSRKFKSAFENMRTNTQKAIKLALNAIKDKHPGLHTHLHNSISTGFECKYEPENLIEWEL